MWSKSPASRLNEPVQITESTGRIGVQTKEQYDALVQRFESAIKRWNNTPGRGKFSLAKFSVEVDGRGDVRFTDPDTDNAWIGFQLATMDQAQSAELL